MYIVFVKITKHGLSHKTFYLYYSGKECWGQHLTLMLSRDEPSIIFVTQTRKGACKIDDADIVYRCLYLVNDDDVSGLYVKVCEYITKERIFHERDTMKV